MIDVGMTNDMRKHSRIIHKVIEAELRWRSKPTTGQIRHQILTDKQHNGADQGKAKDYRRVVLESHLTPPLGFSGFKMIKQ